MASIAPSDFRGTRLRLALALVGARLTQYELAKAMGKSSGSIHGLLRRMVDDGLVLADDLPPTRGTMYELNPEALAALEEAAESGQASGQLSAGQRLLTVRGSRVRTEGMNLLDSAAVAAAVGWVAQTNSSDELLIAVNPAADEVQVNALALVFEEAGFDCREGQVGNIMSAREAREHNQAVRARAKAAR